MSAVVVPLRRSPIERSRWLRKPPAPKKPRALAPGVEIAMPPGWARRAARVLRRDRHLCRRCGERTVVTLHAVDHILPRRLFETGAAASAPRNLAALCRACHGWKTAVVEPALYRGNVLVFETFLRVLAASGPTPSPAMLAGAYGRLRRLLSDD